MSNLGFDVSQYEYNDKSPLPPGWYTAHVKDTALDPNKAQTGKILKLTFEVSEGEYKGRQFWDNLNVFNPNAQAEKIARGELNRLCKAVGIKAQNHEDLRFKKAQFKLDVRKDEGYDAKNVIKDIKPIGEKVVTTESTEAAPW